jgi:hypothetical protein
MLARISHPSQFSIAQTPLPRARAVHEPRCRRLWWPDALETRNPPFCVSKVRKILDRRRIGITATQNRFKISPLMSVFVCVIRPQRPKRSRRPKNGKPRQSTKVAIGQAPDVFANFRTKFAAKQPSGYRPREGEERKCKGRPPCKGDEETGWTEDCLTGGRQMRRMKRGCRTGCHSTAKRAS